MVTSVLPDIATVRTWLDEVPDPEIPVISVTELGIVRDIAWQGDTLVVAVTPTYSGCPAARVIEMEIEAHLLGKGVEKVRVERRLSPAWTTDWITPNAREKLKRYGIAPPIDGTASDGRLRSRAARMAGGNMAVECPRCGSSRTEEVSRFGSTPCKASWRCTDCLEPFDYFKCI
ncbi:Putative 1,2-phenylacetyl-CoA epoxidase, subunit D [Roseivivax sp. THAF40]|uniref:1,2-phenylacetyl-CoA epoxidase subunit PaaD n=1 Tax=unclassified Roseivivax TaxID=2639302 RepID=UPI001268A046|nr:MULTISPECIES: 1,2-phenylacetyl-CoA epoxidase subunit PaaD [unclassified Roseivivax]QFS83512.1 Putative 1,2-phenylacetyl-CoA epoxidase, subunit D [Roseivivax sp. THAF197b]QFT47257.1 Putative 1,2-phenylacetyl-CoA epoxidase, subunit D [Roseivivax sp. THAF40]